MTNKNANNRRQPHSDGGTSESRPFQKLSDEQLLEENEASQQKPAEDLSRTNEDSEASFRQTYSAVVDLARIKQKNILAYSSSRLMNPN